MRSTDGKEFVAIGTPVAATSYDDTKVETGKKYYYKINSNMLLEDNLVQGSLSDSVSVVVADKTPPAMVAGVTVVSSSKNNRIFWDRVKDQGLAGYRVYRRAANEKTAKFIGKASATQTIFVDDNVPKNTQLYYSVTAIDNAKPANESKRSKEVTTRH